MANLSFPPLLPRRGPGFLLALALVLPLPLPLTTAIASAPSAAAPTTTTATTVTRNASVPADAPSLRFRKLGPLGNDDPSMLALLQDRQGFVWIGTHSNGLYRYNGYHAVKFAHQQDKPGALPHDRVAALFEDTQGRLWAGTSNGLARYNPETNDFTPFLPEDGPPNKGIVKNMVADGKGGMWVGTWGGLQHFDPAAGKFTATYQHQPKDAGSLASNDLNALAVDPQGGVWAGTWPGGLDYLAPGATGFRHYRIDRADKPDTRLNIVRALQFDSRHRLWIGTEAGVVMWDTRQSWEQRQLAASPASRVTGFYIDRDGVLWATTLSAGLLRWNEGGKRFDQYQHQPGDPHSLPGNNLRAMMQDRGGMLWVASFTDGVSLANLNTAGFRRHVPHRLDNRDQAASNALLSLAPAPDGKVWLGGNLGLSLYDPASGTVVQRWQGEPGKAGKLSNSIVYSLYQDDAGGPLWAGTPTGLNRLDKAGVHVVRFGNTASDYINAIAPGKQGVLWLGTGNSLVRYDTRSGQHRLYFNDPDDSYSRAVNGTSAVLEDRAGRVWAGSEWNGGGLDLLDPATGRFRHFRHVAGDATSLLDDNVASLHEDARGALWVGTAKGLNQVTVSASGKVTIRSWAQAVNGAKVLALRSDRSGQIWASTIAGLYRLDPASGQSMLYTPSDGLTDGYTVNSVASAADGTLYFGGVHGMTAVTPEAVRSTSTAPQVSITDVTVFNRSLGDSVHDDGIKLEGPLTAPRALTLSSQASVFSIEFAALHYTEPLQNRYAYQLAGFDQQWVYTDAAHRSASYTNLNPGTYTFRVRAANHRGVWSEQPATLSITITPPFWQRWWFRLSAALLALGALACAYRWRIRRLTHQQALLEQLVAARTAQLEESNRKLEALSTTDGLTGVRNRRGFDTALTSEWRRAARTGQTLALMMLDVDHFKKYNDLYGHQAGDASLRRVAELITSHGRRTTDLVARYGGEEFVLLSASTNAADAYGTASAICAELQRLALPHAASPFGVITISIGVAVLAPNEHNTPEALVQLADEALYRAKQKGRNQALLAMDDAEAA